MSVYTMVVLIVGIVMIAEIFKHRSKAAAKMAEANKATLDDATKARINDLEERVRVLERIATDKGVRLKEEIDAL